MVDDAGDVGLHHRAAQRLVVDPLADRRLHQMRAGEEDRAGALDDVDLVAHDRQVGAAGDARADDRRHLEDAGRREPRVVVEDPAVVLAVGEDLVLHRQEDARRVDQVDDRQAVFERDLLRAQDLLDAERELRPGLDRGVVGDHHDVAAVDLPKPRRRRRRRAPRPTRRTCRRPPTGRSRGTGARIAQRRDPLPRRQLALRALARLRLRRRRPRAAAPPRRRAVRARRTSAHAGVETPRRSSGRMRWAARRDLLGSRSIIRAAAAGDFGSGARPAPGPSGNAMSPESARLRSTGSDPFSRRLARIPWDPNQDETR